MGISAGTQPPVTVAVTNFKGGVGKTSVAMNLAYELSLLGERVLLVDLDPQAVLSHLLRSPDGRTLKSASLEDGRSMSNVMAPDACGVERMELADVVRPTRWEGVDAAPANLSLQRVKDATLSNPFVLAFAITDLPRSYDRVVVDTHPDLDIKVTNAICAASKVVVPVRFDGAFAEGLRETLDAVGQTVADLRLEPKGCRVLPTMVDGRTGRDQAGLGLLGMSGAEIFAGLALRDTVKVGEASMRGMAVRELLGAQARFAATVEEYGRLAQAVREWE